MKNILDEFKKFALKGNAVDLAVGIIIGAAFTTVVNSLVKDIIMPPIGLLLRGVDFSNLYLNLSGASYDSLAAAQAAGAPTINYGTFLNNVITFLITAVAVFFLVKLLNELQKRQMKNKEDGKEDVVPTCPFCFETIKKDASRCPHCTAELQPETT